MFFLPGLPVQYRRRVWRDGGEGHAKVEEDDAVTDAAQYLNGCLHGVERDAADVFESVVSLEDTAANEAP